MFRYSSIGVQNIVFIRADLMALLCVTLSCVLSLSHTVPWVGCGT